MLVFLRLLFLLILASMLAVTSWASLQQSLFAIPREVIRNPWFIATLFDAYWAFITFFVWVAWKEGSLAARILWFVALVLLGCGGGSVDPFQRVQVSGTAKLDGEPVKWGSIKLTGEKNEKTQEQAVASYAIRDGQIMSTPDSQGTTAGANDITLIIYATDPSDESKEPVVKGIWLANLSIAEDQPLAIDMKAGELERPARCRMV